VSRGAAETPADTAVRLLGPRAERNVPLGPYTTYRVGGPAEVLFEAQNPEDLERVRTAVGASAIDVLVVGKGSNLLVADGGFAGLAVVLGSDFDTLAIDGRVARAGAAVSLPVLARRTAAAGLSGLEWAVGVPGSVGGGVRMNAGGHGSDIAATLRQVGVADLHNPRPGVVEVPADRLDLSYRHSNLSGHEVVVWAEFGLHPGDAAASEAEIADIVRWRREHQPGGSNAGSVFTNPPGDSAGRLIDAAGLRGLRVGSASVSTKHANFFQADPAGSADDVAALMQEVQRKVQEHSGVRLQPEVRMVGFPAGR
jgi:UDP-N-acetylmuramate dehydrogenase